MPPPRSLTDLLSRVREFDDRVDCAFDALRGHKTADRLFYAASELGDFSLIWHLFGVARGLTSDRKANEAIRLSAVLAAESVLVNGVVKSFFRRRRPEWVSETPRPHKLRRPRSSSFPSGHASAAFTAATLLAEDDPLWPLYYAAAALRGVEPDLREDPSRLRCGRRRGHRHGDRQNCPQSVAKASLRNDPEGRRVAAPHEPVVRRDLGLSLPLRPQRP